MHRVQSFIARNDPAPIPVDEALRRRITEKDWQGLRDTLLELHPSDVADLVMALPAEEEAFVFRLLPKEEAGEVFSAGSAVRR